jgi:hypothetical protein
LKLLSSPSGNGASASFFNITTPSIFVKSKINSILEAVVANNSVTETGDS